MNVLSRGEPKAIPAKGIFGFFLPALSGTIERLELMSRILQICNKMDEEEVAGQQWKVGERQEEQRPQVQVSITYHTAMLSGKVYEYEIPRVVFINRSLS